MFLREVMQSNKKKKKERKQPLTMMNEGSVFQSDGGL